MVKLQLRIQRSEFNGSRQRYILLPRFLFVFAKLTNQPHQYEVRGARVEKTRAPRAERSSSSRYLSFQVGKPFSCLPRYPYKPMATKRDARISTFLLHSADASPSRLELRGARVWSSSTTTSSLPSRARRHRKRGRAVLVLHTRLAPPLQ